jgi:hypothetical protein
LHKLVFNLKFCLNIDHCLLCQLILFVEFFSYTFFDVFLVAGVRETRALVMCRLRQLAGNVCCTTGLIFSGDEPIIYLLRCLAQY